MILTFTTQTKETPTSLLLPAENLLSMQATYSLSEIKSLVRSLDFGSLSILIDLVEEEKEGYSVYELKAIDRFMRLKLTGNIRNEINPAFLLSFN